MRVVWISWPGEGEHDVFIACRQAGIDIKHFAIAQGHLFGSAMEVEFISIGDIANVCNNTPADLYILRYPQQNWTLPHDMSKVVYWASEQGPTRPYVEATIGRFQNVAVNNQVDVAYFKAQYPGKRIFYLPFGGYKQVPHVANDDAHDFIVTANCHYACRCESSLRRLSVERMVIPLLKDYDITIYGGGSDIHAWDQIEVAISRYAGRFHHWQYGEILKRGRMYVGITWNWQHGGYGIQLARALAAGIPVMWSYTAGMHMDGLVSGEHLAVSNDATQTVSLADYYTSHPKELVELGNRGQEWFNNNWRWDLNIRRLVEEVNS